MANVQRTAQVFNLRENRRYLSVYAGVKEAFHTILSPLPGRSMYQEISDKKVGSERSSGFVVIEDSKEFSGNSVYAILERLLEDKEWAEIDLEIEQENEEMRATYLQTTELYTAKDIQGPSTKWKREGRVFAIQDDDEKDLFPAFQFADGKPLPIIKKILEALPDYLSPWQTAFWFESGNGWLGGKAPRECLKNESKVIDAAEQLAKPTIG